MSLLLQNLGCVYRLSADDLYAIILQVMGLYADRRIPEKGKLPLENINCSYHLFLFFSSNLFIVVDYAALNIAFHMILDHLFAHS
jgi:hypothetical protein